MYSAGTTQTIYLQPLVPVKWHSMKVSYKILINHKNVPKKVFSDVSLDDKTLLCSITTGRANDNIVCILWELHKLIICILGLCKVTFHESKLQNSNKS